MDESACGIRSKRTTLTPRDAGGAGPRDNPPLPARALSLVVGPVRLRPEPTRHRAAGRGRRRRRSLSREDSCEGDREPESTIDDYMVTVEVAAARFWRSASACVEASLDALLEVGIAVDRDSNCVTIRIPRCCQSHSRTQRHSAIHSASQLEWRSVESGEPESDTAPGPDRTSASLAPGYPQRAAPAKASRPASRAPSRLSGSSTPPEHTFPINRRSRSSKSGGLAPHSGRCSKPMAAEGQLA